MSKVVPLRRPRPAPQKPAPLDTEPREHSWRDLVRRLAKSPLKD